MLCLLTGEVTARLVTERDPTPFGPLSLPSLYVLLLILALAFINFTIKEDKLKSTASTIDWSSRWLRFDLCRRRGRDCDWHWVPRLSPAFRFDTRASNRLW